MNKVLNPYPVIWLQVGDIERDCDIHEIYREGDITWCQDSQFDTDVRYVLGETRDAEVAELKTRIAELEWALREIERIDVRRNYTTCPDCDRAAKCDVDKTCKVVKYSEIGKIASKALGEK